MENEQTERIGPLWGFLSRLRSPWLFLVVSLLFAADLLVPDILPFVDEMVLGVITLLLARRKRPVVVDDDKPPEKNVTPGVQ